MQKKMHTYIGMCKTNAESHVVRLYLFRFPFLSPNEKYVGYRLVNCTGRINHFRKEKKKKSQRTSDETIKLIKIQFEHRIGTKIIDRAFSKPHLHFSTQSESFRRSVFGPSS